MRSFACAVFACLCWSAAVFAGTMQKEKAFRPPEGKTWLFIGQNKESIDAYAKAFDGKFSGVMLYTSIQELSGLDSPADHGAGVHYGAHLLKRYPEAALQIGLYMVDALDEVNRGEYDDHIVKLARWAGSTKR
ncbi:MAG TPA: hypothetical protein P5246_06680, partial [Candidatus Omnitrophota bacterium]|nr:hypothetical protein [Candidatus Omnitrophota bacterium]